MNDQLQTYARDILKEGLAQCTEGEQLLFKRMYAHANNAKYLELPIDEIVDQMKPDKLDWAMEQVQRTLDKHTNGGNK